MYLVNKPVGITPLQAIRLLRQQKRDLPESLTYAGRLDPLASGVLPIVNGKNAEEKARVMLLPKTYVAEILIGVLTDTGDILGVVQEVVEMDEIGSDDAKKLARRLEGEFDLPVPRYSSVGLSSNVELGEKLMKIKQAKFLETKSVQLVDVLEKLEGVYKTLEGDFREKLIMNSWKKVGEENMWQVLVMEFEVESGTYIRSVAGKLGEILGTPTCLFGLKRTRVGQYGFVDCL